MKKKLLFVLLLVVSCFAFTACGKADNTAGSKKETSTKTEKTKYFSYHDKLNNENYHEVIKELFGFEPVEGDDWEFTAYDFYCNPEEGSANAYYDYRFDFDQNELGSILDGNREQWIKNYFDAISEISTDGVYAYLGYDDNFETIQGEQLIDYDNYKAGGYDDGWVYYWGGSQIHIDVDMAYNGCQVRVDREKTKD
jgi:hypothetical protein